MLRDLLSRLLSREDPMETVVWHADPLVVLNDEGGLVYSGATQIEFTPETPSGEKGLAVALVAGIDEWQPRLFVRQRVDFPLSVDPHIRTRGGFTLLGEDELGEPYTWHIGKAADDYLLGIESHVQSVV